MSFEYSSALKVKSTGHPSPKPSLDNLCVRPGVPNPWTTQQEVSNGQATQQEVSSGQASEQSFICIYSHSSSLALLPELPFSGEISGGIRFSRVQTLQLIVLARDLGCTPLMSHPETIPLPCLWKNYLPQYRSLVPKRLGATVLDQVCSTFPTYLRTTQPGKDCDGLCIRDHWSPLAPGPDSSIFRKLLKFYVSVEIAFKQLTIS